MSRYFELFMGSFDESIQEKIKPENKPYVAYSIKDGKVAYTIVPNEDKTMYTVYAARKKDISELEYNVVDLGLPSGTLWADRNVGALSTEDGGTYFAWGEIEGVNYIGLTTITAGELANVLSGSTEIVELLEELGMELTADNVHEVLTIIYEEDPGYLLNDVFEMGFSLDKTYSWKNYFDVNQETGYDDYGEPISFKKYNNEGGLTTLTPEYDAATVHMGSEWRMPTIGEIQELINNTTITFVDIQGNEYTMEEASNDMIESGCFKGIKLKAENGCSLWLPATNHIEEVYCQNNELQEAYYLSSNLSKTNNRQAEGLYIQFQGDLSYDSIYFYRNCGFAIRGVKA